MNISTNQDCYGCGVCAIVCPQKIISLNYNKLGFLEPKIVDEVKCTNCSICSKVCSFNDVTLSNKAQEINIAYASWSKDSNARKDCSSGGVYIDISKYLFTLGYKICSVRYNPGKNIAEHYLSSNKTELKDSYGSKYIQSYSVDGFSACTNEGKYKNSSADIRLGDAWGKLYANNEKGVSIAVPFTTLGEQILQSCGCVLVKHEFDKLAELQLQTNPSRPAIYSKITAALVKENTTIIDIYGIVIKERIRQKLLARLRNPQRTIINFCKKIIKQ